MKIHVHGNAEEYDQAARVLTRVIYVVSTSDPYPDHGRSHAVRIYIAVCSDP